MYAMAMKAKIKQSYCINTDASPAPIRLPEDKNRIAAGNTYVYIGSEEAPYNVFDVQPNHLAKPIYAFLEGYHIFFVHRFEYLETDPQR